MTARAYVGYGKELARFASRLGRLLLRRRGRGALPGQSVWSLLPPLLEGLGPAFVKMGQLASTRRDLLSPEACAALATLRDDCQALPSRYVAGELAAIEPAGPAGAPAPLGFGSIAGVYLARFPTIGPVAAKVRRPGVTGRMLFDTANARRLARLVARLQKFNQLPLREMVDFLADATEMQVDLVLEGRNLARLRETLAHLQVRIPAPYPALSSENRLVMEYLPAFSRMAGPVAGGTAAATRLLEAVFTMIFRSGFVHLDLHAGNYAWEPDGTLNIIDAGFAVQLSNNSRRQFSEFFIGLSFGNGQRCATSVLRSAVEIPEVLDEPAFVAEISALVHAHRRLPARDFRVAAFTYELFAIQRRHGVFIASEFVAPVLALLTVEEQVRDWAPDLDFQVVAQAIIIGSIALIPGPGR
jgi:ubiquinone biosynthesis protein